MIKIREITDIATLLKWRKEVMREVFGVEASEEMMLANEDYYRTQIPAGNHRAFIACYDGEEAGCGSVCFSRELPSPDNPGGRCGYLMNIYVRKSLRNRGIADSIVKHLVKTASECCCNKIYLESTDTARPLYLANGFSDMNNMMIYKSLLKKYDTDI